VQEGEVQAQLAGHHVGEADGDGERDLARSHAGRIHRLRAAFDPAP
jgi:hypothetical protein